MSVTRFYFLLEFLGNVSEICVQDNTIVRKVASAASTTAVASGAPCSDRTSSPVRVGGYCSIKHRQASAGGALLIVTWKAYSNTY